MEVDEAHHPSQAGEATVHHPPDYFRKGVEKNDNSKGGG